MNADLKSSNELPIPEELKTAILEMNQEVNELNGKIQQSKEFIEMQEARLALQGFIRHVQKKLGITDPSFWQIMPDASAFTKIKTAPLPTPVYSEEQVEATKPN